MRIFKKFAVAAAMMAVFLLFTGAPVYGADSSVIEKLTVTFKSTYGDPGMIPDPEITVSDSRCTLGDIQFRTQYDKWKPGRKVRVEVTLHAEDGRLFPVSLNRTQCKVTGADFVSAKALDDTTLQVKVDYKPIIVLNSTEQAGWNKNSKMKAIWKSVEHAPGYSLILYGDNKVVKRLTVETNYIDLSSYMTNMDKTYYYEVKAIPVTAEQKKYMKEGDLVSSTDQEFDWETRTADDCGSLKGDSYVLPNGSKAVNSWKMVAGKWYYFDRTGNRTRGWFSDGGKWYYMDQNGILCTGWVEVNSAWFYLGPFGDMQTGWIQPVPGNWYYMNADGTMKTGWLNDNGTWYYLASDGSMVVNTLVEGWWVGADGVALR